MICAAVVQVVNHGSTEASSVGASADFTGVLVVNHGFHRGKLGGELTGKPVTPLS